MPSRMTPSQWRSKVRQAQQKQRQAINKYNSAVRKYNQGVKRAVDDYNREVRAHNARVRSNRQRLRTALSRLRTSEPTHRYVSYRVSVEALQQALEGIESQADAGRWGAAAPSVLDLSEGEAANSVEVLNALTTDPGPTADEAQELRQTALTNELAEISPDLDRRWRGALFALDPQNPDAARHFCSSSREIISQVLHGEAPDDQVVANVPRNLMTPEGKPTRRARVHYVLSRKGWQGEELEDFVEKDLENVISLFDVLNAGTHGAAGTFSLGQLAAVKRRVEDAISFLHRITR